MTLHLVDKRLNKYEVYILIARVGTFPQLNKLLFQFFYAKNFLFKSCTTASLKTLFVRDGRKKSEDVGSVT